MMNSTDDPHLQQLAPQLNTSWPCRERQIRQLAALLDPNKPSPSTIVLHGPPATGKTSVVRDLLEKLQLQTATAIATATAAAAGRGSTPTTTTCAILRCKEFVSGRHLLEKTVGAVRDALRSHRHHRGGDDNDPDITVAAGRCENLSMLVVHLQRMMALLLEKSNSNKEVNLIVVFDSVDEQRDAPPTLIPGLARLGEFVPNLTSILIMRSPAPLHKTGVPHIFFPAYTREQSIHILAQEPLDIFLNTTKTSTKQPENVQKGDDGGEGEKESDEDYDDEVHQEDKAWLWPRFCAAVWDSLAQSAARDLVSFRELCRKLWRPFLAPVIAGDFGTRDFSRLVVAQRRLFQDENVLIDSILASPPSTISPSTQGQISSGPTTTTKQSYDLPYYARWLIVAAYLASFNPARLDAVYFMKNSERKTRRKRGGSAAGGRRPSSQTRKIPRHILAASSFTLDRLLAILHAILPHDLRTTIDVYTLLATLSSLRLLVRTAGLGATDPLEPGGKWRVGAPVTWEYAQMLARSLDFDMNAYVAE